MGDYFISQYKDPVIKQKNISLNVSEGFSITAHLDVSGTGCLI